MTGFYRRFIQRYSLTAKPILDYIAKRCEWTSLQDTAFKDLKNKFLSAPLLVHPIWDPGYTFRIHTDACGYAVGYVLEQLDPYGKVIGVIAYGSKKLLPAQLRYSIYEREFLAVIEALKTWRYYLMNRKFIIKTDHKSLIHLKNQNLIDTQRVAKWIDFLSQYDFEVEYIKGHDNSAADVLSRYPELKLLEPAAGLELAAAEVLDALALEDIDKKRSATFLHSIIITSTLEDNAIADITDSGAMIATLTSADESSRSVQSILKWNDDLKQQIIKAYKYDKDLSRVYELLKNGAKLKPSTQDLRHYAQHFRYHNELLYYTTFLGSEYSRLAIPYDKKIKDLLVRQCHDSITAGHFGYFKTFELAHKMFYWPKMLNYIKSFCKSCSVCQRNKTSTQAVQGLFSPLPIPEGRWTDVSMDFVTAVPKTIRDHDMILVIIDRFTKMAHFIATDKTLDAPRCAQLFLAECFKLHGIPHRLVSDKDIRFMNKFWYTFNSMVGTSLLMSTTNHPQTDGQTERVNRVLNQLIRTYCANDLTSWDTMLPMLEFAYNNSIQKSSGMTPFELSQGYRPTSPTFISGTRVDSSRYSPNAEEYVKRMKLVMQQAQDNLVLAQHHQELQHNKKVRTHDFKVGDLILLNKDCFNRKYKYHKVLPVFIGPYRIIKQQGDNAFEIDFPETVHTKRVFNVRWFRHFLQQNAAFPRVPPRTDLEILQRLSEVTAIAAYDREHQTYDVHWKDCDPEHSTSIPTSYLNKMPSQLRSTLMTNLGHLIRLQQYEDHSKDEFGTPPEGYTVD